MAKVRVHELAKQYNKSNNEMIAILSENGITITSHMEALNMSSIKHILDKLEHPESLKTNFVPDFNLEQVVQFIERFSGEKYVKPEKAGDKAEEMILFSNMGGIARSNFLNYAREVVKYFPEMEIQGCTNWINAGQKCPGYLWIELKKKGSQNLVHSISLAIINYLESDEKIKNSISFRVEAKDVNCTPEDYKRHNLLVDITIPEDSGIFYQATKYDDKSYDYGTDQIKTKYDIENNEIRKLKVVKILPMPYTEDRNLELIEKGVEAVKLLMPFYEHIIGTVSNDNKDDDFWPSLEEYDPKLTKEDWINFINEVEKPDHPLPMKMLVGMLELGGQASCKQLSEIYGGTPNAYIGCTMNLGRRAKKYFGKPGCMDDGKERLFVFPFQGKRILLSDGEQYVYRIRPELKAALEGIDLSEFSPYYGDEENEGENLEMKVIEYPKNTILYGPPGTGKTYVTSIYAVAIIENKSVEAVRAELYDDVFKRYLKYKEEGLVTFTTFHQSYGYEEFIEGIKPVIGEGSDGIGYTIEDGVFKAFCEKAKMPNSEIVDYNTKIWKVVLQSGNLVSSNTVKFDCFNAGKIMYDWKTKEEHTGTYAYNQIIHFQEKMNIGDIVVSYAGSGTDIDAIGVVIGDAEYDEKKSSFRWSRSVEWLEYNQVRNIKELNGNKFFDNDSLQQLKRVNVAELLKMLKPQTFTSNEKNYVFIIDEINRGNISKIFGELITLIEDTKRAGMPEEASAVLPYSGQSFSVPSNVYILGTMNTADRSIALMDTALRRRFEFIEMMPNPDVLRAIGADKVEDLDIAKMLEVINERITFLYDREHTIGHAFFTKLAKNPTIENLKSIFEKSVIPLLQEYFYEDYQKIQLVLGDNGKSNPAHKFILDTDVKVKDIFKGNVDDVIDLPEKNYAINSEAFANIDSYKEII